MAFVAKILGLFRKKTPEPVEGEVCIRCGRVWPELPGVSVLFDFGGGGDMAYGASEECCTARRPFRITR